MHIDRIRLIRFKNYTNEMVVFSPGINAIVGRNGMGKTNLLDGIFYLSMGKSHFSASDKFTVCKEEKDFQLDARYTIHDAPVKISMQVVPSKSKVLEIDGERSRKLVDHIGEVPVVVIAPSDIQKIMGVNEERRILMNNTLVQVDRAYLQALMLYNKLLKQRNALLKSAKEGHSLDTTLLEILNERMVSPAQYIWEARKDLIAFFSPLFDTYYQQISGGGECCSVHYESVLDKASMADVLKSSLNSDKFLGRTSKGIHKDHLNFKMNGDELKDFGSQGQQKSFILALKLAQYSYLKKRKNTKPILLLDDIFDKLDEGRVRELLLLLQSEDIGQVFITDTHEERVPDLLKQHHIDFTRISISSGKVT